jgi:import inner membrane translocase subunit TIM50
MVHLFDFPFVSLPRMFPAVRIFVARSRPKEVARRFLSVNVESVNPTKLCLRELKVVPRETRRKLRLEAEKTADSGVFPKNNKSPISRLALRSIIVLTGVGLSGWNFYLTEATKSVIRTKLHDSFLGSVYDFIVAQIAEICRPFTQPSREKLLPDWPMINRGIPEGYPPLPVLVLAVEDVLIHSEWDVSSSCAAVLYFNT